MVTETTVGSGLFGFDGLRTFQRKLNRPSSIPDGSRSKHRTYRVGHRPFFSCNRRDRLRYFDISRICSIRNCEAPAEAAGVLAVLLDVREYLLLRCILYEFGMRQQE